MKRLRKLWFDLISITEKRPRLQRVLCRVGIHARHVTFRGVTFDGAVQALCPVCKRQFEYGGF